MKIQGIDHVEFYVSDPESCANSWQHAYGFAVHGRSEPSGETAAHRSLLLRKGRIQLLITSGPPGSPAGEYVRRHGDGVAVVALRTDDVRAAYAEVVGGPVTGVSPPAYAESAGSRVGMAAVTGFGDVLHSFVERSGPADDFWPGHITMSRPQQADDGLLETIDHLALILPAGELIPTVRLYQQAFGLAEVFEERIEVGGQAMMSKVVQDPAREATFTILEPDVTREPGQIDDFLREHGGAGVQHVALRTTDIRQAVRSAASRGVHFLVTPPEYYRALPGRLGGLSVPVPELAGLHILADRDKWGELFQIFAVSTHERRTFFFELIERRGALTFGTSNIKSLYEALAGERG